MSLAIAIKGPEGIVLAADSRVTLEGRRKDGQALPVNFDNATKLLAFPKHPYVGAVTYGQAVIGLRTAHSLIPEFDLFLRNEIQGEHQRLTVEEFSKKLSKFFLKHWREIVTQETGGGPDMVFIVGGYNEDDPYGKIYLVGIPSSPEPKEQNPGPRVFGMTWGGQLSIVNRIIQGCDPALLNVVKESAKLNDDQFKALQERVRQDFQFPIPYQMLPLQDCIDLAICLIRSTIIFQDLAVLQRGVGGPIDVAVITRPGRLQFVQKKEIRGEAVHGRQGEDHDESSD
jgi:hypothetical protein